MKKLVSFFLSAFAIAVSGNMECRGANTANITAAPFDGTLSEEQDIDISIENNPGIMGFRLSFSYDPSCAEIISVKKGDITAKGMFTPNIDSDSGFVDILWNSTENVLGDGTVAVFTIRSLTDEPYMIETGYSQPDTFNENWEDVELICEPVVTVGFGEQYPLPEEASDVPEQEDPQIPTEAEIPEMTEKKPSLEEHISQMQDKPADTVMISDRQVNEIVSQIVAEKGADTFYDLTFEEQREVMINANEKIEKEYKIENYFADTGDIESVISEVSEADSILAEHEKSEPSDNNTDTDPGNSSLIITAIICGVLGLSIIILINFIRRSCEIQK